MRKQLNKFVAGVAACAFSLVIAATGSTAMAVSFGSGSQSTPTLTIHKYTTPADETEGDGTLKPPSNGAAKPVEGVEYTVYQIQGLDLSKNTDWLKAVELQKKFEANPSKDTLSSQINEQDAKKMTTDNNGIAKFTFSPSVKGLYLVVESSIAGAKVSGQPTSVVGSKPFLVAVPMTDRNTRDKWNYDVHVYPKNAPVTAVKTVQDSSVYGVGDDVKFILTTDIPAKTGTPLNKYVVLDQLNSAQYAYKSVKSVQIENGETLTDNVDYQVTHDSGLVKVTLTSTGLMKLEKSRGGKLVTTLTATVLAVNSSNGEYSNTAYLVPSTDYSETIGGEPGVPGKDGKLPPIPSNTVTEKFAKIVVTKSGTDGKNLAGATFELYACGSKSDLHEKIIINNHQNYVTTDDGTVTIDGVRLSDYYNGEKQDTHQKYCLKEIVAPKGYELLPEPVELDVTADRVAKGTFAVEVKDVPYNAGFHLPLTGSNAVILLGVIGVLLLGGGVILVTRNRQHS